MDFVTHAAVGALLGRAIAPAQARAARWGALAALLPDADHVLEWGSASTYLLHHRTWSHSLLVAVVLIGAAALPAQDRSERTGVVAAGIASHLLLDLCTQWGVGIAWPFSPAMPAWDILPIVCPWLLLLSLGLLALNGKTAGDDPRRRARGARWSLAAVALFLAFQAGVATHARRQAGVVLAVPDWRRPWSGRGVRLEPDRVVIVDGSGAVVEHVPGRTQPRDLDPALGPWLTRFRIPLQRPRDASWEIVDAQFALVAVDRPPFVITPTPPQLTMHPRGVQPLLWLAVFAACLWFTRRSACSQGGGIPARVAESDP